MSSSHTQPKERIAYIDSFRGIAILLVIGFHAFSRWPGIVPYGGQYADITLFRFGWMGVQLFFLVSGFVILMTLEKCAGIRDFLYRRWLRLFPAMLICSGLIYLTLGLFRERPGGTPPAISLIPGITFIDPVWIRCASGHSIPSLEGAFWSLFVEFKFYVIAALLYYFGAAAGTSSSAYSCCSRSG